jgi:pyruvate dehydrogenase E2 component (dihydrolipoamide acetyltransferase)
MALVEVKVPDIGDFKEVEVIELMVKPGDTIAADQSLLTVESDKASMEIPSSHAGVVKELKVKIGDKVGEGTLVLVLEVAGAGAAAAPAAAPAPVAATAAVAAPAAAAPAPAAAPASGPVEVVVPDIGDFDEVAVIEVFVKAGDSVKVEQSLITVESDKASMEIPSSHAGTVAQLLVKVGDKVKQGSPIAGFDGRTRCCHTCGNRIGSSGCRGAGPRPDGGQGLAASRIAFDPPLCARTRRAAGRGQGQRPQGPHHAGRRAGLRQGRDGR